MLNCATQGRAIAKLRQAIALDLASSRLNNQSLGESFLSNNNLILDEQPNERPKIQKAKALHDSGLSESRFSESLSVFI
ncbi:hypothetical protein ACE1B6_09685 [Aerosakkonemataceae cyanobacterium BLCC-F154]|uniref:Uncharacterized protein n=1 Tax=Floridaenema fluviatile BLCC-F154 TaxID=3153640 RepID=A0ABV4Y9P3_9CYAN